MSELGLKLLVINEETKAEANENNRPDLWARAVNDLSISIVVMSPEQLKSSEYAQTLEKEYFSNRIFALTVDEAHLLLTWGKIFRKPFQQIGLARSRLPDNTVLIALTATMRGGEAVKSVRRFLGLTDGYFHLIRRSNQRHDIQLIFRDASSPPTGSSFSELDWILHGKRKTLVFCRSISLGNRVHQYMYYLDKKLGGDPASVTNRMREYNALSKEYNEETRNLMHSGRCSLVFATSTLAIGVDIDDIEDVVIYGDPEDLNELLQMIGRIRPRRDGNPVGTLCGIVYFSPNARKRAEDSLARRHGSSSKTVRLESEAGMDESLAEIYLAECKVNNIDKQYENPPYDDPCHCPTCTRSPPITKRSPCTCTGTNCSPEQVVSTSTQSGTSAHGSVSANAADLPNKNQRISPSLRTHGTRQLKHFRINMFHNGDPSAMIMLPPDAYFTDEEIKKVLDRFALLNTVDDVTLLVSKLGNKRLTPYAQPLFERLQALKVEFDNIKLEEKHKWDEEKKKKKLEKGN